MAVLCSANLKLWTNFWCPAGCTQLKPLPTPALQCVWIQNGVRKTMASSPALPRVGWPWVYLSWVELLRKFLRFISTDFFSCKKQLRWCNTAQLKLIAAVVPPADFAGKDGDLRRPVVGSSTAQVGDRSSEFITSGLMALFALRMRTSGRVNAATQRANRVCLSEILTWDLPKRADLNLCGMKFPPVVNR